MIIINVIRPFRDDLIKPPERVYRMEGGYEIFIGLRCAALQVFVLCDTVLHIIIIEKRDCSYIYDDSFVFKDIWTFGETNMPRRSKIITLKEISTEVYGRET